MAIPSIQPSFSAGEVTPALFGRTDLAKFHVAAATARNVFVDYRGGLSSRAGTAFVARSLQTVGASPPRLIPFSFSVQQGYMLEFGDYYMRVYSQGAPVTQTPLPITGITQANPGVVTIPSHGFANGDWVAIAGVVGMTQLNGRTYIVSNVTTNTFILQTMTGAEVDTIPFSAYISGGTAARIFTLPTPWAAEDLAWLKWTQSADTMSIVCWNQETNANYAPRDLVRIAADNWTLTETTFAASIAAPASCTVSATVAPSSTALPTSYAFVVTAVSASGEESIASPVGNVTNSVDIAMTAGSLIVNWSAVVGAVTYNIYKAPASYNTQPGSTTNALPVPIGSLFGYAGTSYSAQFVDSNITPDLQQVPPTHQNPFAAGAVIAVPLSSGGASVTSCSITITTSTGAGFVGSAVIVGGVVQAVVITESGAGYASTDTPVFTVNSGATAPVGTLTLTPESGTFPGCVAYFQQRRVYAASPNDPDTYWMSKPGAFLNFDTSVPSSPDDAITGTPWSLEVNGIQWMVPMPGGLVVLTGKGAWQVSGTGSTAGTQQALTPTSQQAQPQAFNGCSPTVPPVAINYDILYVQAKGAIVRDLSYNYWINIYTGADITMLSSHLFNNYQIVQWAWCEEPYKLLWAVRNDGSLLSLTFIKEQEMYGWTRHDTTGTVQSVASVTELPVDALYLAVQRPGNDGSAFSFYIERMDNHLWQSSEDPWCVDAGLATVLTEPDAWLAATELSGTANIMTTASVFTAASVGQIVRAAGGIGTITLVVSGTQAHLEWQLSPSASFPGSIAGQFVAYPLTAAPGDWSIAPQVTEVSGLDHLIGDEVVGLADGVPLAPQVVPSSGTIALPFPASDVRVGLPFTVQVQSVYLMGGSQPTLQGRRKDVVGLTARLDASGLPTLGANQQDGSVQSPPALAMPWTNMTPPQVTQGTYTSPGGALVSKLFTGDARINIAVGWDKRGQVAVEQTQPLPLHLTAFIPEWLPGDMPEEGIQGGAPRQPGRAEPGLPNGEAMPSVPGPWMMR